jgi:hypothetical protein
MKAGSGTHVDFRKYTPELRQFRSSCTNWCYIISNALKTARLNDKQFSHPQFDIRQETDRSH